MGPKEFQKGNINSAEQLLVGKVAGLSEPQEAVLPEAEAVSVFVVGHH